MLVKPLMAFMGVRRPCDMLARKADRPEASAASLPPPLLRWLPTGATVVRWESHPPKISAFPRQEAAEPSQDQPAPEGCPLVVSGLPNRYGWRIPPAVSR